MDKLTGEQQIQKLLNSVNSNKLPNQYSTEQFASDDATQNYSCKSHNAKSFMLCFVIIILLYLIINSGCKYNQN